VNLCDGREVIGVSTPGFRRTGVFAEYVTLLADGSISTGPTKATL
jgi:hypothetical protein